jgi:hypothetical protein
MSNDEAGGSFSPSSKLKGFLKGCVLAFFSFI